MPSKSPDTPKPGTSKKAGRGRPRDPKAADAIREATTELLSEEGYHGLTMAGVARRAGVAKTTIYRRWTSKAEMVLDAVTDPFEPRAFDDTGDPVSDLRNIIAQFYRRISVRSDPDVPIAPAELLREADVAETFRAHFVEPMLERALALVQLAIDQGHLREDVDPATLVDTLTAPAIYQPVVLGHPADADTPERVFDLVIQGARAD